MSNVEIQLDYKAIGDLLKSDEVVEVLNQEADNVMSRLNGSYEKTEHIGVHRANVSVATADKDTYYRNLKNNDLLKAMR